MQQSSPPFKRVIVKSKPCSDIAKSTMDITKIQKEEAKIIAWESQQKANKRRVLTEGSSCQRVSCMI
ncbi:hypothetical protein HN51_040613 [Arachis hypogaea]